MNLLRSPGLLAQAAAANSNSNALVYSMHPVPDERHSFSGVSNATVLQVHVEHSPVYTDCVSAQQVSAAAPALLCQSLSIRQCNA